MWERLLVRYRAQFSPRTRWTIEAVLIVLGCFVVLIASSLFWFRLADLQWASYIR